MRLLREPHIPSTNNENTSYEPAWEPSSLDYTGALILELLASRNVAYKPPSL